MPFFGAYLVLIWCLFSPKWNEIERNRARIGVLKRPYIGISHDTVYCVKLRLYNYESEGRRFESCRARHFEIRTATMVAVFFVFGGVAASAVY